MTVKLTDSLDRVIGAKSAGPLEEHFGIRTVDDLLRHYPRSYSQGMTVLDADWEPPEEGEHVTFVDVIDKADVRWTNRQPKREFLVITLANRKPKVTATFFNAKYTKKILVEGTSLMLSGEVGFFNRAIVRVDRDELSIAHRPWPWFGALRRNGRMLHLEARPFRDSS